MSIHKTNKPELLIKFNETENAKQLDEMIYQFEKNINNKKEDYFLKESENPYIFFLESKATRINKRNKKMKI